MEQSAHLEAVDCFERSLTALQHLPENRDTMAQGIDLRLELRSPPVSLGKPERLLVYLQEAERLAEALGDQHRLAWVSGYMCGYFYRNADHERAVLCGQRALALSTNDGDRALWISTHFGLSQAYSYLGDHKQSIALNRNIVTSLGDDEQHERFGMSGFVSVFSRQVLARGLAECGASPPS